MADESDDRWTVRGVSKPTREKAAEAAARRKSSVGAFLAHAVDVAVAAEREPIDLIVRPPPADKPADIADTLSAAGADLAVVERAIAAAVALAGAPEVPTGFRRRANRLLREALPAPAPRAIIAGGRARLRAIADAAD